MSFTRKPDRRGERKIGVKFTYHPQSDLLHRTTIYQTDTCYTQIPEAIILFELTKEWLHALANRLPDTIGRTLFQRLFANITVEDATELRLTVGTHLLNFPFAALRTDVGGEAPAYLGLRMEIAVRRAGLPTREQPYPSGRKDQMIAFAPLPTLRYGAAELGRLQQRYRGRFLRGKDASVQELLTAAPNYRYVHLTTHGDGSSLLLMQNGRAVRVMTEQLAKIRFSAELVCLSSCPSGLVPTFLQAGARNVVAARWPVDDRATAELMGYFYAHLEAGSRVPGALRLARRDFWQANRATRFAHPFYWAGFGCFLSAEA